jgi:uncharacterized RDD family membrane protein YckC
MKKCVYCEKEYPDDATSCVIDNYPLEEAQSETIPNGRKSPSAGYWIRFLARFIDFIFSMVLGFAAGILGVEMIVILGAVGIVAPGWQERMHNFSLAPFVLGLVGNIAYHSLCEGIHGATLGKLCCGIRVMREDMKPSNLKGAFIRTLAYFIDSIFFGCVGYASMSKSPLNQRYGDRWGKTVVVKIKEISPQEDPQIGRFMVGLLAGAGSWIVLVVISLIWKVS